jgi:hypothetical protein
MQDRSPPTRQIFLLRTAGPYIGSKADIQRCLTNVRSREMSALCQKRTFPLQLSGERLTMFMAIRRANGRFI